MKNTKLKKYLLIGGLAVMLFMTACGKKEAAKNYDVKASELTGELAGALNFEDAIAEVDDQTVLSQYELKDAQLKDVSAYMSSAATTEEIAVFVCEDGKSAADVKEKCEQRIERQSDVYESYAPAEVERLKKSYLEIKGNLVIFCVSEDKAGVEKVVDDFLKNR